MDDNPESELKKMCCTCLSRDRKLSQLCRVPNGVNNLYFLLTYDPDAYTEGFYKDTANLFICWECKAIMRRISAFRQQACIAQRHLTAVADGRTNVTSQICSLSRLTEYHTASFQTLVSHIPSEADNFIDCGPACEIKIESDDDIPLSELNINSDDNTDCKYTLKVENLTGNTGNNLENGIPSEKPTDNKTVRCKRKSKYKNGILLMDEYIKSDVMSEDELVKCAVSRRTEESFVNATYKCESCIEIFRSGVGLNKHNSTVHVEKDNVARCDICYVYINPKLLPNHRQSHYYRHLCKLCEYVAYTVKDILRHLKNQHYMKNFIVKTKKQQKSVISESLSNGLKSQKNNFPKDVKTSSGYLCGYCNKYFDNKNQRWKHVQRHHKEGYKCPTCGKNFAFKNSLTRHELRHTTPHPREECAVCHKMVRVDLVKAHALIHSSRERYRCCACDKCFVSRASYEHHLKYTQAHAAVDVLKYKCGTCDKGYRSQGELRDHVNYQHMGKTQHKCPICGKALATPRCITRHIRRAHEGIKERGRENICQQCGKTFRDKKGLREHEMIHTGERPLACELCGSTFRQSASLYTHRKRVHKLCPPSRSVQLVS